MLGGSAFVGRSVVEEGLARGWAVTTFNRGRGGWADPRVERLTGDRLVRGDLDQLRGQSFDLVVDTWSGAPRAVLDSAALLADRAERYAYVSSRSVYALPVPLGADESAPTVEAAPDAAGGSYATRKRGAELAVEAAFGRRALLARAGAILGPYEDVGRLPWWLLRMERGGEVLAPGPPGLSLQYVDARDLARWLLDAASSDVWGPVDVVCRSGHATTAALLEACRAAVGSADAALSWVDPEFVLDADVEPWDGLPLWIPEGHEYRWMHEASVERAYSAGLACRPVEQTVRDTWDWLVAIGRQPPLRADLDPPGLDPADERAVLAAWHAR